MTARIQRPAVLIAIAITFAMAFTAMPRVERAGAAPDGSGGRAVAHRAGSGPINSAGARRNAPDARLQRITVEGAPIKAGEPTLGFTKSGDVFYAAIQTNTRVEVAHSGNGGRTWDLRSPMIGTRNAHLLTFDPYIYVDPRTDRIFNIDLTVACSYLSFSDDKGKSWTTNPVACGRPVNDHQTLFAGPPAISPTVDYKSVVYYCWNDVGTSSCTKSLDGGLSFAPTGSPAYPGIDPAAGGQGNPQCGGLHGHGHVGPDGTVYVPKGHCGQPWISISNDEGATWTRVQVANNGTATHEASVATDKKGNVYYGWVGRDRMPYLSVSKNGGKSWGKPMMVGVPGLKEANLPSIDVGAPGKVAFAYMGSTNSPYKPNGKYEQVECTLIEQQLDQCDDPRWKNTTWNGYMTISANVLDREPLFYSGSVNAPSDPLSRGNCGPGRCKAVYDFIDVVIAPDGTPWSSWVDACTTVCSGPGGTNNIGADAITGSFAGGPRLR